MLRRCIIFARLLPVVATALGLACAPAQAEPGEERYAGLAFTYYFGDSADADGSADLSLGAMERSIDIYQDASVMLLPVVMVPLLQRGEPMLAPVAALVGAVQYLGSGRWLTTVPDTAANLGAASKALSLPDLGAK